MGTVVAMLVLLAQSIGDVESTADKNVDFGAYRTYAWSQGREAFDPATHAVIVAAIDAELARLGFRKADAAGADVTVRYNSVQSSYVEKDAAKKAHKERRLDPAPARLLGSLVVQMQAGGTGDPVWEGRTRRLLSDTAAIRHEEMRIAVADLFETYPRDTHKRAK